MMKIKCIVLALWVSFNCNAQSEPEKIRAKDMIEKVDRSEIETQTSDNPIKIDAELTKIKFDNPLITKPVVENKNTKKPKKTDPKIQVQESVEKPEELETDKDLKSKKVKKKPILVSKRKMSLNNLLVNDIVVDSEITTYVYRKVKSNTIQYKYIGTMPFYSKGLKELRNNRYSIVDLGILKEDAKSGKDPNSKIRTETNNTQTSVVALTESSSADTLLDKDKFKKQIEASLNDGKVIEDTLELKKIMRNDVIHLTKAGNLVERRSFSSIAIRFYWLTEPINTESRSLKKLSETKYKVIKHKYVP